MKKINEEIISSKILIKVYRLLSKHVKYTDYIGDCNKRGDTVTMFGPYIDYFQGRKQIQLVLDLPFDISKLIFYGIDKNDLNEIDKKINLISKDVVHYILRKSGEKIEYFAAKIFDNPEQPDMFLFVYGTK